MNSAIYDVINSCILHVFETKKNRNGYITLEASVVM